MSEKNDVKVKAKNLKGALKKAAELLTVDVDDLDYQIISQVGGGLLFFLGGSVEIKAWSKSARGSRHGAMARNNDTDKVAREEVEYSQEELAGLTEDLRVFCENICTRIAGEPVAVAAELIEDRLILNIGSEFLAEQMDKNAKLAESLEHLLRKKPRHIKRELPFRIFIDVNGMRREREDDLIELAQDLSAKVDQNKRPIVLNYRSAYDRKIIHMALDKDDRVYTKSIGHGANRKLMILPARGGDGDGDGREGELID